MPPVEDALADLAAHPPAHPTPVGEIRGRAARRVRRRRLVTGAAVAVVVLAAGIGVTVAASEDPGGEVIADGGTSTASDPATTTGSLAADDATVILDPASGHDDGTAVEISFAEPTTGPISIAQCAREVVGAGGGSTVVSWCVDIVSGTAEDPPPYTLSRVIHTSSGSIDCAVEPARCILGVRVGDQATSTDDRFAPLVFREDLAPPLEPAVVVDGDEGGVGDGDTLLITLTGVATGELITVSQCRTDLPPEQADEQGDQCSSARGRALTVQDGPETQLTFTAFHDIFVNLAPSGYDPGWAPCAPCALVVRVGDRHDPVARLPMEMEPTDAPIRPQVTLDPPGPHPSGGVVTIRASGLQPGAVVGVGWCPTARLQGGGDDPCTYPDPRGDPYQEVPSTAVPVADDGTLVLADFPLPGVGAGDVGLDCVAEPGACGIGLAADDAFSVLAVAPLDLSA